MIKEFFFSFFGTSDKGKFASSSFHLLLTLKDKARRGRRIVEEVFAEVHRVVGAKRGLDWYHLQKVENVISTYISLYQLIIGGLYIKISKKFTYIIKKLSDKIIIYYYTNPNF